MLAQIGDPRLLSPLAEGRGLKLYKDARVDMRILVAPRRGAWIEIDVVTKMLLSERGRPSQRGVD